MHRSKLRAYVLLISTAVCWGMNVIFAELAVGQISPMVLVMLRWLVVLILLVLCFRKQIIQDWQSLRSRPIYIFAMGGLGYTGFASLLYLAAYSTSAVNLGILQGSIPVFIILGAYIVFQTKFSAVQFFGILTTFVGVMVVSTEGSLENLALLAFKFGDVLMILACAFYAGYALGLRVRPESSALALFALMAGAAFVASLPLLTIEILLGQSQWPNLMGWIIVGLVALFPSFLAQIFFMKGIEIIGPSRAGVFANLVPVFGSIFAVIILGEEFVVFQGVALVLVLGGIWISERGNK